VEVIFVLIESEDDRNVGSVARALTTMGYSDLRLVRPPFVTTVLIERMPLLMGRH
jgi:tRNA C32,U32 (ribose-2'-O)-methylase TrmJ